MQEHIGSQLSGLESPYTVVGEDHKDPYVGDQVVSPLIEENDYDNIYLEALLRGSYTEEGESLIPEDKVYGYLPEKYDQIIEVAESEGVSVHGLDNHGESRKSWDEEISDWADYILETEGEKNLILTGHGHVDFWQYEQRDENLLQHLVSKGVNENDLLIFTTPARKHESEEGVYDADDIEELSLTRDYIYLNDFTNNEDIRKITDFLITFKEI